jgi:hypothetical protein
VAEFPATTPARSLLIAPSDGIRQISSGTELPAFIIPAPSSITAQSLRIRQDQIAAEIPPITFHTPLYPIASSAETLPTEAHENLMSIVVTSLQNGWDWFDYGKKVLSNFRDHVKEPVITTTQIKV